MPATTRKYRPPHTSERAMTVKNSCRFHALVIIRAHETNGEQLIRKDGRPYTHSGRLKLAKVLRYHAAQRRGEPPLAADGFNRDQALYAYDQVFPTGHAVAADLTPAQMRLRLEGGWAMTVSGNVDSVPASSPLDDFVNDVPHEIAVLPFPNDHGPLVDEPMRPRGAGLIRVSWSDLNRFTSEFKDSQNRRHCVVVRAGWDTEKARRQRADARVITRTRADRDEAAARVIEQDREIAALTIQLTECREDGDPEAAREQLLDALHDWETEQRL